MALAEGSALPDFSLPDQTGATVTLADLKGKPFVLYFYPKDDTSGCTSEAIAFSGLTSDFDALGVPVIGISPDPVKKHVKFVEKHDLKVRLLSDEEKIFLEACGVWVEKSMYGKKYMGVERTTVLVSADGTVAKLWSKVKVPGHAEAVLEAAKAHSSS
ncbi:MAG: thioredoxin-dependent thiol peroxidase [Fulvimarina manganoxydans]|uniref:thioredoxin-dependent thiol peroxidase n=1 Tax=Fulvimarina manganoxydans TaxID=937218 RepID=UPI002357C900|nr:thioredoxin-dependent thiol peroxidase [Fulvimarina manganoxydans]MCK5931879.1 thioredoxin-dependent thiol peroxidase [Fulvimarina manganoxydans]